MSYSNRSILKGTSAHSSNASRRLAQRVTISAPEEPIDEAGPSNSDTPMRASRALTNIPSGTRRSPPPLPDRSDEQDDASPEFRYDEDEDGEYSEEASDYDQSGPSTYRQHTLDDRDEDYQVDMNRPIQRYWQPAAETGLGYAPPQTYAPPSWQWPQQWQPPYRAAPPMNQTEKPTNVVRLEGRTPVHATGDNVTIQIGGTYVTRTTQPEEDDNKHPNEKDLEWMHGA